MPDNRKLPAKRITDAAAHEQRVRAARQAMLEQMKLDALDG
jgi:hypothetical protein